MSGVQSIEVTSGEDGMRLDRWFKVRFPKLGHGALQKLLRTGQVRLDGGRAKANARVSEGQVVRVPPLDDTAQSAPRRRDTVKPEDREFIQNAVIFRDNDVIVLNKPSGLASQGGSKTSRHVDGMLDALKFDADERPRLVHRLDRDTSGVLLLARNRKAANALSRSFKSREAEKTYWALVSGVPRPDAGIIRLALVKTGRAGEQRMGVADAGDPDAQRAESIYKVVERAGQTFAWLAVSPLTGRTHQIRVHLAEIGHPVVGDGKYGAGPAVEEGLSERRLHLHARRLKLPHPRKGVIDVTAPLPPHMTNTWSELGFDENDGNDDLLFAEEESGA